LAVLRIDAILAWCLDIEQLNATWQKTLGAHLTKCQCQVSGMTVQVDDADHIVLAEPVAINKALNQLLPHSTSSLR